MYVLFSLHFTYHMEFSKRRYMLFRKHCMKSRQVQVNARFFKYRILYIIISVTVIFLEWLIFTNMSYKHVRADATITQNY